MSAHHRRPFYTEPATRACECRLCGGEIAKNQTRLVLQIEDDNKDGGEGLGLIDSFHHPACTLCACLFTKASRKGNCVASGRRLGKGAVRFAIPCSKEPCDEFHDFTRHQFTAAGPWYFPAGPALRAILGDSLNLLSSIKGCNTVLSQVERDQITKPVEGDDADPHNNNAGGNGEVEVLVEVDDDSGSGSGSDDDGSDGDDGIHVPGGGARGGGGPPNKKARTA